MNFETYLDIMQNHGIGEMVFNFLGKEFCVEEEFNADGCGCLTFLLIMPKDKGKNEYVYENINELVEAKVFNSRSLREIWNEIEIISIDGVSADEYDPEECSFNFVKAVSEFGEIQWKYFLSTKQSFLYQLKYLIMVMIIFPLLSMLFPAFGVANWYIVLFVFGCSLIAVISGAVASLKNRVSFNYIVTNKKIMVFKGFTVETTYENIKKVKLKKSLFNKNTGNIKIYVKKGLSINFHILSIPNPENIYNLILTNWHAKV